MLRSDDRSILVISGGQTKAAAGPVSEAQSYYNLLAKLAGDDAVLQRVVLEEYARDSFENVLFSLCRFYELRHTYPEHVTIVGFEFKRTRFVQHHLPALKFPVESVTYVGNAPTPSANHQEYFAELDRSEYAYAVKLFEQDWYGARDPLRAKKQSRDPFNRTHTYHETNAGLAGFFAAIEAGRSNEQIQTSLEPGWANCNIDSK